MKHLGDITKINGAEVPLVDVITGGSPCQDLSVAGNRAGLSGERSGLFMEQIRIIKEMRKESERLLSIQKPNYDRRDIKPRYMVWENVQGAFSSNGGEDFRVVLEETAKVAEGSAVIPKSPEGKWSKSGCIMGNGWSIAWRLHDAQFWGVPQRRKRISLVADFGGSSSPEILFERKGLSWNTEQSEQEGEETSRIVAESIGRTSESTSYTLKIRGGSDTYIKSDGSIGTAGKGALIQKELSGTLGVSQDQTLFANCYSVDQGAGKSQCCIGIELAPTLSTTHYGEPVIYETRHKVEENLLLGKETYQKCTGLLLASGYNKLGTQEATNDMYVVQNVRNNKEGTSIYRKQGHPQNSEQGQGWEATDVNDTLNVFDNSENRTPTLILENHPHDSRIKIDETNTFQTLSSRMGTGGNNTPMVLEKLSVVRRLTPLECERLQGFPDNWTNIGEWIDSSGKKHKDADSPRYKALGNSIALPFWDWMAERMCNKLREDGNNDLKMASLFDGIGGFPLVYQKHGCKPVWASEIEEFPIAVTKIRFKEESED